VLLLSGGCAHTPGPTAGEAHEAPTAATKHSAHATADLPKPDGASLDGNVNVALGIPLDGDPSDDYLIDRIYWVSSYNPKRLGPNWVAWRLVADDIGSVDRRDTFRADSALPEDFKKVGKRDYAGSGYDRGHICPSADRTSSIGANDATFLMSNMLPQVPALNRGPWKILEGYERGLAGQGKQVQIVAGGIFSTETVKIGPGVDVPAANFKIIVVLEPKQGASDVTTSTPLCAVIIPNKPEVKGTKWYEYLVTVDEIEKQTGYDFLRDVPDEVEDVIEAKVPTPQECGAPP
jgi:endonuclease G